MCCITKSRRPDRTGCLNRELKPDSKTPGKETQTAPGTAGAAALRAMLFPEVGETPSPKRSCYSFADSPPPPSAPSLRARHVIVHGSNDAPEGHINGSSRHTWPDGASYDGQYRNGQKHGRGRFVWASGAEYDGEFVEGRLEGSGVLRWPDGSAYQGSWKDGRMDGFGHFTYPDGQSYEGEYQNDLKHGQGVFRWPDGKKYEGQWKDGVQHGSGTFTSSSGKIKAAEFLDGQRTRGQPRTSGSI